MRLGRRQDHAQHLLILDLAEARHDGALIRGRDVAVGVILSLALGILFVYLFTTHANQATALLLGNVLGVSIDTVWDILVLGGTCLLALAAISRPLLFATHEPELAEVKGVSLRL